MADNTIITPGYQEDIIDEVEQTAEQCLIKDNCLSEYDNDSDRSRVRANIEVPHIEDVYNKSEVDNKVSQVKQDLFLHLNQEDPHGTLATAREEYRDMVKNDGSTPFREAQEGVYPTKDTHLSTKEYVDNTLKKHIKDSDPHNIIPEVEEILQKYAKLTDIFSKSSLYTKNDIDKQLKEYVKRDGSTPFTSPQIGKDPTISGHLSTKRYVDSVMNNHLVSVDPHGFIALLNNRLSAYIKAKDVYDKTQTYSRTQIDSIVNRIVNSAIDLALQDYMNMVDDRFEDIRLQKYVKQDGSTPFLNPQSGVDAKSESDLITLRQLNKAIQDLKESIPSDEWKTSGPVEATVGMVQENAELPQTMTFQEIMDAIFYGQSISINTEKYTTINHKCPVTLCIHGSLGTVLYAELYQGEELIQTLYKEDFENGCVTVESSPILSDTEFTFKVYYSNEAIHEEKSYTKCCFPVFVGLLPKWKFGNTITMDYLEELERSDTEGTQNRFLNYGNDLESFTFYYKFQDPELKHPFIVIPESYPDLENIITSSQKFGIDAFDVIDKIPLKVTGVREDIIFKIYIYRQALSSLNQDITFNFSK